MFHMLHDIMARGPSGRIVVEIDPKRKHALYAALAADGLTFKDWLIAASENYLSHRDQPSLPGIVFFPSTQSRVAEAPTKYATRKEDK